MSDLISYSEQFEKIVAIIESAKERAYRKVNQELILMYRYIGYKDLIAVDFTE